MALESAVTAEEYSETTPSFLAPSIRRSVRSGPERFATSAMVCAEAPDVIARKAIRASDGAHFSLSPEGRGPG
jgi:hypothetical protein